MNVVSLTREAVRAMTWDQLDATTVEQRRQYVRDVMHLEVGDDENIPVGVLCLSLPSEITPADIEAARRFAAEHLGDFRG